MENKARLGAIAGALAGLGYAFTVICGRNLAKAHLNVATVLSIRFAVSGAVLVAVCLIRRIPPRPVRGEWLGIFLLGAVGYMVESSFFFAAIARGSTAAVSLLFYVYPAMVTVIEAVRGRRFPSKVVLGALGLSITGSALVAGAGGHVDIQRMGVVFALCSATTFASYVTVGARLTEKSDPMATGAWVALGASASFTVRAVVGPGYAATAGHWPILLGNGVANALAFGMMFAALALLGPARASVVLTLEAVFTVILSFVILHEPLAGIQLVGAVAVLLAAVTVARSSGSEIVEEEAAVP
ncbi:MAG TPA: DMT family transporter [Acidimicrobiales bacterium]|nr:DMT family transporter [Acidimicrobiales bacterium]